MGICYQLWSKHFSVIGLSTLGAFTHNTTQLAVACFMYEQIGFFYLLPYLLFFAIPTGFFVGIVTQQLVKKYGYSLEYILEVKQFIAVDVAEMHIQLGQLRQAR